MGLVLAVLLCACSGSSRTTLVVGAGLEALPSDSASDWLTYADVIERATVVSERPIEPADPSTPEQLIGRRVFLHTDEIHWTRPGAPVRGDDAEVDAWGWVSKGGKRIATVARGEARLEVDYTYLLALARFADRGWAPIGSGGAAPFDGGVVGHGEWAGNPNRHMTAGALLTSLLDGRSDRVAEAIAAGHANPHAAQLAGLDPVTRYQRIQALERPH